MCDNEPSLFSELKLFVCTYVAKLENIHVNFKTLTHILCNNLSGKVLAINSNYGHASQEGFEQFIKTFKKNSNDSKGRMRKIQGDGTCFNSAVEPVIRLDETAKKFYYIKCFPSTGETQIPGVIDPNLQDGHDVLVEFVSLLNSLSLGTEENGQVKPIFILSEGPKMLNYKFKLNVESNTLINLMRLSEYLFVLNSNQCSNTDWVIVSPPYCLKEIKTAIDDIKVSFKFQTSTKRFPRVNIFQGGKINILGAESVESAKNIYNFLGNIFKHNWTKLVSTKPVKGL